MPVTSQRPKSPEEPDEARPARIRRTALNLLARREHSILELNHKLTRRGFESAEVDGIIEQLVAEDLLSDARYAEVYAHSRVDRGYGPLRISRELRERGVPDGVVGSLLVDLADEWPATIARAHRKRFGGRLPGNAIEEAAQLRFLRHRGFTFEQIKRLFQGK
jgi:regulatory protein